MLNKIRIKSLKLHFLLHYINKFIIKFIDKYFFQYNNPHKILSLLFIVQHNVFEIK